MVDTRILLSGLWVALVLNNLWGDVLRIFAGDVKLGEIDGVVPTQRVWLGIAVLMLIPILMVLLNLTLPYPAIRWVNIIVGILSFVVLGATFFVGGVTARYTFQAIGEALLFALIIWQSWNWPKQEI